MFNDKHTADDWGLILSAKTNNPPAPKYVKISVDGRDGDLNLSRTLTGDIKYNKRDVSYTFTAVEGSQADRQALLAEIINEIHGRELNIIEPDDPDHYLVGECTVGAISENKAYLTFTITAECEPYRYASDEVNREILLTNTPTNIVLTNGGVKTIIPTVTVTGSVNIEFDGVKVALSSGSYKLTSLIMRKGFTTITVSGSGTLIVSYREGII
jgi:hypothetical protein